MKYEGMIIRPPSEAESLLLQATVGCSHNRCTFCGTYKEKKFRIKDFSEIDEDIREAEFFPWHRRLFLCDGDALIIPQNRLVPILEDIRARLPWIERVGAYANAKAVLRKTPEELADLHRLGLRIVYLGVETGQETLLARIRKGAGADRLVEAARRIRRAGISLSVTVVLGLGGVEDSAGHALATARILTAMDPDYVGALTLMLIPGTPLHAEWRAGRFVLPDAFDCLKELETIVEASRFTNCLFTSNHASNYLSIRAKLPDERERALRAIRSVLGDRKRERLRPEYLRAL